LLYFTLFYNKNRTYNPKGEITQEQVDQSFQLLNDALTNKRYTYIDFLKTVSRDHTLKDTEGEIISGSEYVSDDYAKEIVDLKRDIPATYQVDVEEAGYYYIEIDYRSISQSLNDLTLAVKINDTYQFDESKDDFFKDDRFVYYDNNGRIP